MAIPTIDIEAHLDADHLAAIRALPVRDDPGDFAARRASIAELRAAMPAVQLPEDVVLEDHMAPHPEAGPEGAPDVMVRTYRPASLPANAPALYWIHGGGMVVGDVQMNDPYCAGIASKLNVLVASVEYRLAPEHPFPAPIEDCYAGLRWLSSSADALGIDRTRVAIGGGSAGGGLAAGLALVVRDRGEVESASSCWSIRCLMIETRPAAVTRLSIPVSGIVPPTSPAGTPISQVMREARMSLPTRPRPEPRIWRGCRPPTSMWARWIYLSTKTSLTPRRCWPQTCRPSCTSTREPSTALPTWRRTPRSQRVGDETNSQRSTARSMERDSLTQPKISPTHQQDTPARHASKAR